ncbi:MAG: SCO family protein [Chloroflexota bacterium]
MKKIIPYLFVLLLIACSSPEPTPTPTPPHTFAGVELSAPHPVPDGELISTSGPVRLSDFRGKYVYVYFGYTFCPDICPMTLSTLQLMRSQLGEDSPIDPEKIQVVMVTVDPARDTAEVMTTYMGYFDESFVGLTGEQSQIDAVGDPFGLYYKKGEGSVDTGYLVDHTSRFYLIDPEGNARVAYAHDTDDDLLLADLTYLWENN